LGIAGSFGPHFLNVLEDHIAMAIKGFDSGEKFAIVATGNQDLGMRSNGGLKDRQRTGGELMFLQKLDLVFTARQNG
jgi:hypothetical protein